MSKREIWAELVSVFTKIGLFTFGGGYAMISLIEHECVEKKHWLTHEALMDITVIAESTPGPIAINCATYVGYQQAGFVGATLATIGIVFPSFMVIYLISLFFDNFLEIELIAHAFEGIKVAVAVLILGVAIKMVQRMPKKPQQLATILGSLAAMLIINFGHLHLSSLYIILASGFVGYILFRLQRPKQSTGGGK